MINIGVIGLGYVGLPLAIELSNNFSVYGYDKNKSRISELIKFFDSTNEVNSERLKKVVKKSLHLSSSEDSLELCNVFIVTVPTPITLEKNPDLLPLKSACQTIGKYLKKNDTVFFESTVYPGCTEEFCVPILEKSSGLKFNTDFEVGYSPERINPGDKVNTLRNIKKVISGSSEKCLDLAKTIYGSIIDAGLHVAPTIKVAEAAKVIENTQRDVNIAFMNELNSIFSKMGINIYDVLEASGSKWNFLPFLPGLVGGHCIGVDPYYLSFKALSIGHNPEIILSGRRINDEAANFYAMKIISQINNSASLNLNSLNVLILGGTFKENCPDFRNTKVVDLYNNLKKYLRCNLSVYDPKIIREDFNQQFPAVNLISEFVGIYDVVVLAVKHEEFLKFDISKITNSNSLLFDLKNFLPKELNPIVI